MARKAGGERIKTELSGTAPKKPMAAETSTKRTRDARRRVREETRGRTKRARRKGRAARMIPKRRARERAGMSSVPMSLLKYGRELRAGLRQSR
jgi:hypothetical protein